MTIESWWPKLDAHDQEWLIAHNGEAVEPDVLRRIAGLGGLICSSEDLAGETRPDGFYLSDAAVDWIEATANGETADGTADADRDEAHGTIAS